MPKEVFGATTASSTARSCSPSRRSSGVARVFVALGVEKLRLTGGEPLVRKDVERLIAHARAARRRADADDERLAARAEGAGARRRRACDRVTVSLDSLDDETFRAMNDVDFPVRAVLDGIDAAAAAGLPVKVNAVVKRGLNDDAIVDDGAALPRHGPHAALHRVHGRRRHERLAARRRRPGGRDRRADRGRVPARAGRGELPRRGRAALALPRRRRRDRRDRLGHAAVLRRLHARADLGRGPALHLPLRPPRARPARARPRRRLRRRAAATRSPRSGASAPTATRSCARRRPSTCRRSR